ncbi:unnamed protein product [Rhodiola kirilowii]
MGPLSKLACTWGASLTRLSRRCHAAVAVNPAAGAPAGRAVVDEFTRFCYQRDLPRAMRAMEAMERSGLYADAVTYSELIKCCLARRAVDDGKRVHRHVCSAGYEPKTFLINILLNMYVKFSLLDDARKLFDKMPDRNVVSWTTMIAGYSKWGELRNALGVFNEMVTGDSIVWNSIIGGFAQNNEGDEAMNIFKRMKRAGFVANQASLTSVLRACTSLSLLELGRQVHVHILKYDRDLILENALLDMYCKCGSLEDAKGVFTRMVDKDVISWSTMVAGLAQNGYSKEALRLFDAMKGSSGIRPNYITLLGVLFACSHAGLVDDGWYYFQSMNRLYGIEPGREHYGCMVDLLGRAGKLDAAAKLISEMKCEPDAVTWRMLLASCRVHKNVDLAAHAAEQILKLDPTDVGTYILLSNIYANSQRWDDVASIRKAMQVEGVRKEPGCSWIEVDMKIHCFVLGDKSHPMAGAISVELNQLVQRLRGFGYNPDTNFVLQDVEGEEQREDLLRYHSEKLAIVFGLMSLATGKIIRIRKNLRICGDCHIFAKLVAQVTKRTIVIRDPIRYHHFHDGICSCGDYW